MDLKLAVINYSATGGTYQLERGGKEVTAQVVTGREHQESAV